MKLTSFPAGGCFKDRLILRGWSYRPHPANNVFWIAIEFEDARGEFFVVPNDADFDNECGIRGPFTSAFKALQFAHVLNKMEGNFDGD